MYILYMQILKVIIKVKQNLKWEKEFNIVAEVRTMLFMREDLTAFPVHVCSHIRTTQTHDKHCSHLWPARAYREARVFFILSMPHLLTGGSSHFHLLS